MGKCMDMKRFETSRWRPHIEPDAGPKYLGIVEALAADLRSGLLRAGDRLPAQRAVAKSLGVDLTTVTRAFNEARARGLIDATTGRGSFISNEAKAGPAEPLPELPSMDLSMNIPPQPEKIGLDRRFAETVATVLARPGGMAHLHYQESGGSESDRGAGAGWLGERIAGLSPERVLVAGGSQSALFALCHVLARPGDTIAAGAVTYPGIHAVAGKLGLRLAGLAMDREGIVPEAFEDECGKRKLAALYVVPSIDNPTTATLPEERRATLAEIARAHGVPIIEDDPYIELLEAAPPPIASFAPELTWHVATLSKCVTPALRIAYVAAPDRAGADLVASVLRATSLMAPPLMAAVASRWIVSGAIRDIIGAIREESRVRQALASAALADFAFAADPHGHHLWLPMPRQWRAIEFAHQAERSGLSVVPSSAFAVGPAAPEAVRIALGAASNRTALAMALARLNDLLAQPPQSARMVV